MSPSAIVLSVTGKEFASLVKYFASVSVFEYTPKFVLAVATFVTAAKLSDFCKNTELANPPSVPAFKLALSTDIVTVVPVFAIDSPVLIAKLLKFKEPVVKSTKRPVPDPKFVAELTVADELIVISFASADNVTPVPPTSDLN